MLSFGQNHHFGLEYTTLKTKMTGWKIHDVFPIEHGDFPASHSLVFRGVSYLGFLEVSFFVLQKERFQDLFITTHFGRSFHRIWWILENILDIKHFQVDETIIKWLPAAPRHTAALMTPASLMRTWTVMVGWKTGEQ